MREPNSPRMIKGITTIIVTTICLMGVSRAIKHAKQLDTCINVKNKMCQTTTGALALNISACGKMFSVTGESDAVNSCALLSECSTNPGTWKCLVAGHPIDCFHCIEKNHLARFRSNREAPSNTENSKETLLKSAEVEVNEVIVLFVAVIGFITSIVLMIRHYRGVIVKPIIPIVMLFAVCFIAIVNMIIDLSS